MAVYNGLWFVIKENFCDNQFNICARNWDIKDAYFCCFTRTVRGYSDGFKEINFGYPRTVHMRISNCMHTCPRKRVHLSGVCTVWLLKVHANCLTVKLWFSATLYMVYQFNKQ